MGKNLGIASPTLIVVIAIFILVLLWVMIYFIRRYFRNRRKNENSQENTTVSEETEKATNPNDVKLQLGTYLYKRSSSKRLYDQI